MNYWKSQVSRHLQALVVIFVLMGTNLSRWNSTFLMFERFLTLQDSVKALLLDEEWKKKLKVSIRSDEWILMERVVKVLKIFSDATLQFNHLLLPASLRWFQLFLPSSLLLVLVVLVIMGSKILRKGSMLTSFPG
jgi:hypothetical protein